MPVNKIDLGPTGLTVADNIRHFREARRLGYTELSRALADLGRTIAPLGLRRIEAGDRRCDVDDLVALALALNVSPLALLLPRTNGPIVSKGDASSELLATRVWAWGRGEHPLVGDDRLRFVVDSNPFMGLSSLLSIFGFWWTRV